MEPKRRRLQYTVGSLKNAVEEIKAGMPFKTASKNMAFQEEPFETR
jgi:hypothetical protein